MINGKQNITFNSFINSTWEKHSKLINDAQRGKQICADET